MKLNKKLVVVVGFVALLVIWACSNSGLPDLKPYTAPSESAPASKVESPTTEDTTTKRFETLNVDAGNVVILSGVVGMETFDVVPQINKYSNSGKPTFLIINSPGGSVMDGADIIAAIQSSKAPVYTVCVKLCASMAALTLEYGVKRYATDRSIIMFHPASVQSLVQGELDKVVSRFSFLKRYIDKMDSYVAARSGQTYDSLKAKTTQELWLDAEDALRGNYIDAVVRIPNIGKYTENATPNNLQKKIDLDATAK